ncbi:hypothetical protein LDFHOB_10440 [Candidatus Electronema aureum]
MMARFSRPSKRSTDEELTEAERNQIYALKQAGDQKGGYNQQMHGTQPRGGEAAAQRRLIHLSARFTEERR